MLCLPESSPCLGDLEGGRTRVPFLRGLEELEGGEAAVDDAGARMPVLDDRDGAAEAGGVFEELIGGDGGRAAAADDQRVGHEASVVMTAALGAPEAARAVSSCASIRTMRRARAPSAAASPSRAATTRMRSWSSPWA